MGRENLVPTISRNKLNQERKISGLAEPTSAGKAWIWKDRKAEEEIQPSSSRAGTTFESLCNSCAEDLSIEHLQENCHQGSFILLVSKIGGTGGIENDPRQIVRTGLGTGANIVQTKSGTTPVTQLSQRNRILDAPRKATDTHIDTIP